MLFAVAIVGVWAFDKLAVAVNASQLVVVAADAATLVVVVAFVCTVIAVTDVCFYFRKSGRFCVATANETKILNYDAKGSVL